MDRSPLPWFLWVPMAGFALGATVCFVLSYGHLTPEARKQGSRAVLRGPLARQDIFTPRGWRLRLWAFSLFGLALLTLAIAGVRAAQVP